MAVHTLDVTNPDYFHLVRERMEQKTVLDCFIQTRRLLEEHAPIQSCLDIGCASGYLYFHIRDVIRNYHGVDASAKFIRYGRHRFKKEQISNVSLHCSRLEKFTHPNKFDALITLGLFYIFPNYHDTLDQMMQMTEKLIIIRSLFADKSCCRYVPERPGSPYWTYYNIYAMEEVAGLATSRGWNVTWHEDDHVRNVGGYYETGGLEFPFKFLVLTREE